MITYAASQPHRFQTANSLCALVHVLFRSTMAIHILRAFCPLWEPSSGGFSSLPSQHNFPHPFHPGASPTATLQLQQLLCNLSFLSTDNLCRHTANANRLLALRLQGATPSGSTPHTCFPHRAQHYYRYLHRLALSFSGIIVQR